MWIFGYGSLMWNLEDLEDHVKASYEAKINFKSKRNFRTKPFWG